ncbi:MAG: hypothetical protein NXY57DRAFT_408872 [Lentinula lateritia]|uniref:Uncharacterized protein n=1 Tax=Lentinula lateritia TaxID=40482 RepID=A0ABQ8VPW2_9AGAR|nr:MAG: hypothetical protein NXY57DRAFT_408872 [Lentinula lateritia]KAJ4497249.1 hypothetical protein C8R41DRAFT_823814 [Lentinula lateritia]
MRCTINSNSPRSQGPHSLSPPDQSLARRSPGRWILRERAAKTYRLELKDLDVIDPIERRVNPHGPAPIRKYNEQDVAALSRRLFAAANRVGDTLAVRSGASIVRSRALSTYPGLTRAQLDTIPPISVEPNPYSPNSAPMRYYNVRDIEALRVDMQKLKYEIQG